MLVKLESIRSLIEPLTSIKERWASSLRTALDRTQTNIERLSSKIDQLEQSLLAVSPFALGPRVVVKRFFLTTDIDIPPPSEPPGTVLIYVIKQDSVGSHAATFPSPPFYSMFDDAATAGADAVAGFAFTKESENEILPILTGIIVAGP
jgi:hypothetical protein